MIVALKKENDFLYESFLSLNYLCHIFSFRLLGKDAIFSWSKSEFESRKEKCKSIWRNGTRKRFKIFLLKGGFGSTPKMVSNVVWRNGKRAWFRIRSFQGLRVQISLLLNLHKLNLWCRNSIFCLFFHKLVTRFFPFYSCFFTFLSYSPPRLRRQ